jgi:carotenoid cleavage dioxygenase-like enzyme
MSQRNRPPVAEEQTLPNLIVEGVVPPALRGTLYRNGPNPMRPEPDNHWFMGDGMVHGFTIRDGGIDYRNRWVRTQNWAAEAGACPDGLPDGVANTHIVSHAGALMALEEAHLPVLLDGASLATLGTQDFGGALPPGPFTAHPKICPATGNLVFFGYGADGMFGPAIRLGEIAPDGTLCRLDTITAPYGAMIHDFAVTERFIAIPLFPLVLNDRRDGLAWAPARGCFLGIIDRKGGAGTLRWLPVPPCFAYHVANAWDDADGLTIDLMLAGAPEFFPVADGAPAASTDSVLTRWRVAPGGTAVAATRLSVTDGEFPRIDERAAGRRNRHTYWAITGGLLAYDDATGLSARYDLPPGDAMSEPVFVARGAAEGDGWLLATVYRSETHRSDLVILDAKDLESGPIATARLPVRVPDGFHGSWVGDAS